MERDQTAVLIKAIKERDRNTVRSAMMERGIDDADVSDGWASKFIETAISMSRRMPLEAFVTAVLSAPDELGAAEFAQTHLEDGFPPALKAAPDVIRLAGASPLLAGYLAQNDGHPGDQPLAEEEYLKACSSIPHQQDTPLLLRQLKNGLIAQIALRDVAGLADFATTVSGISSLAREVLRYSVGYTASATGTDIAQGFAVIGMGKLGADELNYSSDLDIIYTASDHLYERVGVQKITRFAEQLTSFLSSQMSGGLLYRIDLDLRPDGRHGMLVPSLSRMLTYYESWGETWERLALIKASHCAGDDTVSSAFLRGVEPFVFRRYLDFSTIDALKDIKQRIQLSLIKGLEQTWDVKLGEGGIRELEFSIQVMQLIRGGKEKGLRVRPSLKTIETLNRYGMLEDNRAAELMQSYILLRTLEHRIQQYQMIQSHRMPADRKDERRVLRGIMTPKERLQPDAQSTASARLSRAKDAVHGFFEEMFYEQERLIETQRPRDIVQLFLTDTPESPIREKLSSMGFRDIDRAIEYMKFLRDGVPNTRYSERTKRMFNWLAPVFLKSASETTDPDAALEHLVEFMKKIGARGIFFSLLKENPKTLSTLIKFFSMSDYLSHLLINYPEYLDSLVLARYVSLERTYQDMEDELRNAYRQLTDYEDRLRLIREFRIKETLRIGINDINGDLNIVEVSEQLSMLADVIINITLESVIEELEPAYGTLPDIKENGIAVIGMGKLGSRELNYNSDLDLIFIYGSDRQTTKQMSAQEYFSKVVQRFITAISVSTESGHAYNIDTRLRPSGNLGPLVAHIDSFVRYHKESSMLWEKQALLKARGVFGPDGLLRRFSSAINDVLASVEKDDLLRKDIHDMRMRLEKSVQDDTANFNFKKGVGGLMDIEFIVQYLELLYGAQDPSLYEKNTFLAIEVLMEKGYISKKDMDRLKDGYMFLRKIENRMRIDRDFSVEKVARNEKDLYPIALRMGLKNGGCGKEILDTLMAKTSMIRKVYSTYLYP